MALKWEIIFIMQMVTPKLVMGQVSTIKRAAETGYLSRINLSDGIGASSNQEAPNDVEKVNDRAVGYENQYMFAYQNYLYFTSANQHQTASLENDYTRVSVFQGEIQW